jgi:HK97 family phage major capsid protein
VTQTLPSTGTLNNKVLLMFGDLSQASTMGSRRGIRFQTTDVRYWETDEIGVKGTERFDIVVHDVGDATTCGPVVALLGNT